MKSKEFNKTVTSGNNGFLHLLINLALLAFSIWLVVSFAKFDCMLDAEGEPTAWILLPILTGVFMFFIYLLDLIGFMVVQPNESRVLTFFGKYSGTVKQNGFFWVNPFYSKEKLSLRAKNMDVEPIKVNDKNGNPIMIGLVLVWKINDTYKACFEVDSDVRSTITENSMKSVKSFDSFVRVQSDAALRKVAGMYAYDNMDRNDEEVTLRSGGEEINERLESELRKHLEIAGIEVVEARINYLAYAAEIASVMLRRQQADAIISAREKIVEGAVSMVDLALKKLSEDKIVELDEERKAAMVSNLLVVLCADESASPVINTGTLYQ
ncbi:MAG: SPFH domain-containing protein [Bacteroidales bacterium]|nr:SPFH domain-containing protein [Bacteroidales bacterium]